MWYTRRWGIEVLHRTLKSGCRIEQRQLAHADRLEACLAIDLVVAWRIDHLSKRGREVPQAPCTVYFEEARVEGSDGIHHAQSNRTGQATQSARGDSSRSGLGWFLGSQVRR